MEESQQLMADLIRLRKVSEETNSVDDIKAYNKQMAICIDSFQYLIRMRTGRYKSFSNYDDLNQEGTEALLKAMKTYDPSKGNWFGWAHNYIATRISRSANLHTTIRFPLKVAKANPPHKESVMPIQIEDRFCPDKELENSQTHYAIQNALASLSQEQKEIVGLAYGFDGDKPMSINKICKKLNISRIFCIKTISSSLSLMKENIKI